tara:strand:- start:2222 stop:2491 length:270 start_codon:yes stop_codon:yes gene_type:complete
MKVSIIIVKTLFVSALFIVSNYNLHLVDDVEREVFFDFYLAWLEGAYDAGADITGNVVNFEWLPPNNMTVDSVSRDRNFFFGNLILGLV